MQVTRFVPVKKLELRAARSIDQPIWGYIADSLLKRQETKRWKPSEVRMF